MATTPQPTLLDAPGGGRGDHPARDPARDPAREQAREPGGGPGSELLAGLDPSQRAAVVSDLAPLAILAGPGSGKTRVLTRRIAWQARVGRIEAAHTLAVTFTRKAAGELGHRLAGLDTPGITTGTVHSVALGQLRRHALDHGRNAPEVLESKARLLAGLVGAPRAEAWVVAREIAGEIEWAKASLVGPDDYAAAIERTQRIAPRPVAEIVELYTRYELQLRRRRALDFEDLLGRCAEALEGDAAFAAAQRWRFRHLFVDEFQDVSPLQLRLLRAWLGDRQDLCVVGDPDQAIYAFAGAEAGYLRGFAALFPGGHAVRLDHNYRSTPQIVAVAEALLADGGPTRPTRVAIRPRGPAPTVTEYETEQAEAAGVVARLAAVRATHGTWGASAILYRTNAQSSAFEEELARAGIPTRVRSDQRLGDPPSETRADDDQDAVQLLTFHRAKGLEFPVVFVTGLERGLVPISHATTPAARAEERRLLYVALSRAGQELHLSYGRQRTLGTRAVPRNRSPWLAPIEQAIAPRRGTAPRVKPGTKTGNGSGGLSGARAALAAVRSDLDDGADPVLHAALVEWRRNLARASGVPAYVIFPDTTLHAVATARPAHRDALLALPGVGPVKIERHGDAVLDLVRRHTR